MRRIEPLYALALALFVATIAAAAATGGAGTPGSADRTASVHDDTTGGAAAFRRYLEVMGARTTVAEGDAFRIPEGTAILFVLGSRELFTAQEAAGIKRFVDAGGVLVLATEVGLFERPVLDAFGVRVTGLALAGAHPLANAAFSDPPSRMIAIDRGVTFSLDAGRVALASDGDKAFVVAGTSGRGLFYMVGSVAPFLTGALGLEDNGAFALGLSRLGIPGSLVAFDEYHHGFHPSTDALVLLERTAPGHALIFATLVVLLFLALSGRRLGPAVPVEARPSRSSLEYIRGFAGLARRSGRGEIARRRMREELRTSLARELGLDPAVPFERVAVALDAVDRRRAAEARVVDASLQQPLREDQLLRTVRQIERITRATSA